ncbi:peptidoglycan DD-metalloendopeptidase family protein [Georgenia halophila]|uniref:Peptidoglycan DD-metalloendopeptidase family protein n=1 Tax=Georgenia halophila TaxID=620889 RepID=A0ABP8L6Z0_9MICO
MLATGLAAAGLAALAPGAAASFPTPDPWSGEKRPLVLAPDPQAPYQAGTSYQWPTGGPAPVLRGYDAPAAIWAAGHRGVDLELAPGAPVLAAADGAVVFAGSVVDRPVVSIEHRDGIRTTYEPVRPAVEPGHRVDGGEVIGHLVPGHCGPPSSCLHVGARTGPDSYVDPLELLGANVVIRLLP